MVLTTIDRSQLMRAALADGPGPSSAMTEIASRWFQRRLDKQRVNGLSGPNDKDTLGGGTLRPEARRTDGARYTPWGVHPDQPPPAGGAAMAPY